MFWDPRLLRKCWLDALSQATDGYLRSTAFLELMQHGLETMIDAKSPSPTSNDVLVEGDSPR